MYEIEQRESRNLHAEKDLVLPLEFSQNGKEIGLEQARNMREDEAVKAEGVGLEPFELFGGDQAFFAHLLPPPPYR